METTKYNILAYIGIFTFVVIGIIIAIGYIQGDGTSLTTDVTDSKVITIDTPVYLKEDFNTDYGVISIADKSSNKIVEYSLTKNTEQCLINCEAEGKAILYQDGKLFEGKEFVSTTGLETLSNSQYWIKINESYQVEDNTYKEVCSEELNKNGTEICNWVVDEYKNKTQYNVYWEKYNYEILKAGNYEWRLTGEKRIDQNIDFQLVSNGQTLKQWAWWNSTWTKKKSINAYTTASTWNNYTILIPVTYDADMVNNFSDLRFTNGNENLELGYWIQNKTDGVSANIWVNTSLTQSANTTIYMYYGNPSATSSTSSRGNVFTDYNSLGISITSVSDTAHTAPMGMQLEATTNIIISSINKTASETTTTRGLLIDGSHGVYNTEYMSDPTDIWATGTFSNTRADLTQPYVLNTGTEFWLATDNNGGARTSYAGNGNSYPYIRDGAKWEAAVNWNTNVRTDQASGWIFSINGFYYTKNANPTIYFGAEVSTIVYCNFTGYVKDNAGGALNGAEVIVFNQNNKSELYNTTSVASGVWTINITNSTKNYTALAYFNNSLVGIAKPYILGTC